MVVDNHYSLKTSSNIDKRVINFRNRDDRPFVLHQLSEPRWYRSFTVRHLVLIVHTTSATGVINAAETGE